MDRFTFAEKIEAGKIQSIERKLMKIEVEHAKASVPEE